MSLADLPPGEAISPCDVPKVLLDPSKGLIKRLIRSCRTLQTTRLCVFSKRSRLRAGDLAGAQIDLEHALQQERHPAILLALAEPCFLRVIRGGHATSWRRLDKKPPVMLISRRRWLRCTCNWVKWIWLKLNGLAPCEAPRHSVLTRQSCVWPTALFLQVPTTIVPGKRSPIEIGKSPSFG